MVVRQNHHLRSPIFFLPTRPFGTATTIGSNIYLKKKKRKIEGDFDINSSHSSWSLSIYLLGNGFLTHKVVVDTHFWSGYSIKQKSSSGAWRVTGNLTLSGYMNTTGRDNWIDGKRPASTPQIISVYQNRCREDLGQNPTGGVGQTERKREKEREKKGSQS